MTEEKTAAMLIGFGGPQSAVEVRPFLESVLEGIRVPQKRFDEVLRHYEVIGGVSPYCEASYRQKEALKRWLVSQKVSLPVGVGFRHSKPTFREAFKAFKKYRVKKVIGFVLASFRSYSSFEKYQIKILEGRHEAKADDISITYTDFFAKHPLYLEAQAEQALETIKSFSEEEKRGAYFLFSAHSIPGSLCEESCQKISEWHCYGSQFYEASACVAKRLSLTSNAWSVAYQSRSGNAGDFWLEPNVQDAIRRLETKKYRRVLLIPIGFLCDNVEVIYDLDVEVRQCCETLGFQYFRASTVSDHPKFIEMIGRQILEKI